MQKWDAGPIHHFPSFSIRSIQGLEHCTMGHHGSGQEVEVEIIDDDQYEDDQDRPAFLFHASSQSKWSSFREVSAVSWLKFAQKDASNFNHENLVVKSIWSCTGPQVVLLVPFYGLPGDGVQSVSTGQSVGKPRSGVLHRNHLSSFLSSGDQRLCGREERSNRGALAIKVGPGQLAYVYQYVPVPSSGVFQYLYFMYVYNYMLNIA